MVSEKTQLYDEQNLSQQRVLHFQRLQEIERQIHTKRMRVLDQLMHMELLQHQHLQPYHEAAQPQPHSMPVPNPEHGIACPVMAEVLSTSNAQENCTSQEESRSISDDQQGDYYERRRNNEALNMDARYLQDQTAELNRLCLQFQERELEQESRMEEILQRIHNNLRNPAPDSSQDPVPNSIGQEGPSSNTSDRIWEEQTLSDYQQVSVRVLNDEQQLPRLQLRALHFQRIRDIARQIHLERLRHLEREVELELMEHGHLQAMPEQHHEAAQPQPNSMPVPYRVLYTGFKYRWTRAHAWTLSGDQQVSVRVLNDEQQLPRLQQCALHFQRLRDLSRQLGVERLRYLEQLLELELIEHRHLHPMPVPASFPEYYTLGSNTDVPGLMHALAIPHCDYYSDESESDTSQESWQN